MKTVERQTMTPRILEIPRKEIPQNWLTEEERKQAPDVVFHVYITKASEKPPYEVPKKYPEGVKKLVREAMKEAEQKGYTREEAIKDFFEVQKEISDHLKQAQQ